MTDFRTVIKHVYSAFNKRDTDGVLALMTEDVSWPKASEGGTVIGKAEIRAYWNRQWSEFDPHVEPVEIDVEEEETVCVRVHQLVKTVAGLVLSEGEVILLYTFRSGLIATMRLVAGQDGISEPSAAFAHPPTPTPS